jgi:hypothetical protein
MYRIHSAAFDGLHFRLIGILVEKDIEEKLFSGDGTFREALVLASHLLDIVGQGSVRRVFEDAMDGLLARSCTLSNGNSTQIRGPFQPPTNEGGGGMAYR